MKNTVVENPDVVLIGSGIMSSSLGVILKWMEPALRIQLYEITDEVALESSNGWNNAGTGHAGICEVAYTPNFDANGNVIIDKAIEIFNQFERSKQFWGSAVAEGIISNPSEFVNPVPHISFVYDKPQVDFLRSRYEGMRKHHFFAQMEYTEDPAVIKQWAPLLLEGRPSSQLIAATKMDGGTDVNFGALSNKLVHWLSQQEGCGVAMGHRVCSLKKRGNGGWTLGVEAVKSGQSHTTDAAFVFVGAGGGSLPLLQKSGIAEAKTYGGFPIGGNWLVTDNPALVEQHEAKVYGISPGAAPTMAVPHLDTRIIDGKKYLLFGPYASWTTRFLQNGGSALDIAKSVRLHNILPMIKIGLTNMGLTRYLIEQGTQTMEDRIKALHAFYPAAKQADWKLIKAGIRVQSIKKQDGDTGIVHFGTEVVTDEARSISALLGASPGASVSVHVMLEVVQKCFQHLLKKPDCYARLKGIIPCFDQDLSTPEMAERYRELAPISEKNLDLNQ